MNSGLKIEFTRGFRKRVQKIKDKKLLQRIRRISLKIKENPNCGKPLKAPFRGFRSVKIPPFRIIYRITKNKVILTTFKHRKKAYKP